MGFFTIILLVVVFYLGYVLGKQEGSNKFPERELLQRNAEWIGFIASYLQSAKNKAEKHIISKMLGDLRAQGQQVPYFEHEDTSDAERREIQQQPNVSQQTGQQSANTFSSAVSANISSQHQKISQQQLQLDSASTLLYFGAFLFVSATGLFVALGDVPGALRSGIVGLVSVLFYVSGLWLFETKKRFKQAGTAFVGIGMSLLPLAGLATYNLVFNESNGAVVWLTTSLFCALMYWHALTEIRKPILNYVFLFTILSLFQSGIALFDSPIYVFGWGMQIVGIAYSLFSYFTKVDRDIKQAAYQTGQFLVPLTAVASLVLIGAEGMLQFGISVAIASAYYISEAYMNSVGRKDHLLTGHMLAIVALGSITYDLSGDNLAVTLWTMLGVVWLHAAALIVKQVFYARSSFMSIAISLASVVAIASTAERSVALCAFLTAALLPLVLWLRNVYDWLYLVGGIFLTALPLVYGQLHVTEKLDAKDQAIAFGVVLIAQIALYKKSSLLEGMHRIAGQFLLALTIVSTLVAAYIADGSTAIYASWLVGLTMIILWLLDKDKSWLESSALLVAVPLIRYSWDSVEAFAIISVALLYAIGITLLFRREFTRWLGTLLWLVFIFILGNGSLGREWSSDMYAYAFVGGAFGLVLARSIARGVVFRSAKVALSTYEKSASLAYVFGYLLAMTVSTLIALVQYQEYPWLLPIVIGSWVGLLVLLAYKVEKETSLYGAAAVATICFVYSLLRPNDQDLGLVHVANISAIVIACLYYVLFSRVQQQLRIYAIAAAALPATFSIFGVVLPVVWSTAISLVVVGGLLYFYVGREQGKREVSQAIMLIGVMWLLYLQGVENFNIYAHMIAILFGFFAYQRYVLKQSAVADQYIMLALASSTVPLALSSLSSLNGSLYGWILLLEQVLFMVIGIYIGKKLLFRWGLYVGVLSVLFQLRDLAWAALTFLAIVVIAVAVYEIQKREK